MNSQDVRIRGRVHEQPAWPLWLRWVGANGLAELVGLGATLVVDFVIISRVAAAPSVLASLVGIVLVTASGAIEGTVVGVLQWLVIRRPFPWIARRAWVTATVVGAVVAWFLGSLPSTLMDMGAQDTGAPPPEPAMATVLLLAAGMGAVLGIVLALPQWRVLRGQIGRAWWWLPANSAGWALGMPVIFTTIDLAQRTSSPVLVAATLAGGLVVAGAAVGAIHGLALVAFARSREVATA